MLHCSCCYSLILKSSKKTFSLKGKVSTSESMEGYWQINNLMTNSKVMTMQWFVKVTTPPPFDHSTPEVLGITETWRFKKTSPQHNLDPHCE